MVKPTVGRFLDDVQILTCYKPGYILTYLSILKIFKTIKEPAKELPVLCQFFLKNCEFFEVFEMTGIDSSLILNL
jgi:hypothetical protein